MTGISAMPSCRAASTLAWPAIRPPSSPTSARRRPAPLLDARRDRRDLGIRVGPGISCIRDQPIDRPPLDLVGRPRSLISGRLSRAGARAPRERGSVGAFYDRRRSCAPATARSTRPRAITNRIRGGCIIGEVDLCLVQPSERAGGCAPTDAGAGWRGRRSDCGPRQGARRPAARHRQDPGNGRRGLDRGAEAGLRKPRGEFAPAVVSVRKTGEL